MKNWKATDRIVRRLIVGVGCAGVAVSVASGSTEESLTWGEAITHLVTDSEVALAKARVVDGLAKRAIASPTTDPRLRECVTEWQAVRRDPDQSWKWQVLSRCGLVFEAAARIDVTSERWSVLATGQALGERAARIADRDPAGALERLIEEIRFGQRYQRGQAGPIMSATGTAVVTDALDHANTIVWRSRPSNLDDLVTAVDAVIANEPSFREAVVMDGLVVAGDMGLQRLDHQVAPTDLDSRGHAITNMFSGLENPAKLARACPATASFAACARALARPLQVARKSGTSTAIVLQAMFESNTAYYAMGARVHLDERASAHAKMIALRLQLEVLRAGCDSPSLTRLATTRMLGDLMRLKRVGSELVVSPPEWVSRGEPTRISCTR